MLPGESLEQLAALIYPKSSDMQRRFVAATLDLNRNQLAGWTGKRSFDHGGNLRIPDLRRVPWVGGVLPEGRMPVSVNTAAGAGHATSPSTRKPVSTSVMDAQQQDRERRLEALNQRLKALEKPSGDVQETSPENAPLSDQAGGKSLKRVPAPELPESGVLGTPYVLGLGAAVLLLAAAGWAWKRRTKRRPVKRAAVVPDLLDDPLVPRQAPVLEDALHTQERAMATLTQEGIAIGEMESIVEEAKVIVAMGRIGNAIKLLLDHIDMHPTSSVSAWLYLLELYQSTGDRRSFDTMASRMHEIYNVMVPAWEASVIPTTTPSSLEEFPHIMQRITDGWGTHGCSDYLNKLIQDNRRGERTGFSTGVFDEIILLLAILEHRDKL